MPSATLWCASSAGPTASAARVRQRQGDPPRARRHPGAAAALPLQGVRGPFDDLTGTVLAGHHQPLRVRVLCLYLMGLNLSNRQIAQELDLAEADVQAVTEQLR